MQRFHVSAAVKVTHAVCDWVCIWQTAQPG